MIVMNEGIKMDRTILDNMTARELCFVEDTTTLEFILQVRLNAALGVIKAMQASAEAIAELGDDL